MTTKKELIFDQAVHASCLPELFPTLEDIQNQRPSLKVAPDTIVTIKEFQDVVKEQPFYTCVDSNVILEDVHSLIKDYKDFFENVDLPVSESIYVEIILVKEYPLVTFKASTLDEAGAYVPPTITLNTESYEFKPNVKYTFVTGFVVSVPSVANCKVLDPDTKLVADAPKKKKRRQKEANKNLDPILFDPNKQRQHNSIIVPKLARFPGCDSVLHLVSARNPEDGLLTLTFQVTEEIKMDFIGVEIHARRTTDDLKVTVESTDDSKPVLFKKNDSHQMVKNLKIKFDVTSFEVCDNLVSFKAGTDMKNPTAKIQFAAPVLFTPRKRGCYDAETTATLGFSAPNCQIAPKLFVAPGGFVSGKNTHCVSFLQSTVSQVLCNDPIPYTDVNSSLLNGAFGKWPDYKDYAKEFRRLKSNLQSLSRLAKEVPLLLKDVGAEVFSSLRLFEYLDASELSPEALKKKLACSDKELFAKRDNTNNIPFSASIKQSLKKLASIFNDKAPPPAKKLKAGDSPQDIEQQCSRSP